MRISPFPLVIITILFTFSCVPSTDTNPNTGPTEAPEQPLTDNLVTYIMGHSLLLHENHQDPDISYSTADTSVPQWFALMASESELGFSVAGQYGFVRNHAQFPPRSQWGFDEAESAWSDDYAVEFSQVGFNSLIFTTGNFIQYQGPDENYYDGDPSPLYYSDLIFRWVNQQDPDIHFFIYENWPDLGPRITPATDENDRLTNHSGAASSYLDEYNSYTLGDFHDWWMEFYNTLKVDFPGLRMIPVGPILSELIENTVVGDIALDELYEDGAPHGRPNIYLLAAMITFMDIYGIDAPAIELPDMINPLIRNNYGDLVEYIDGRLEYYHSQM